MYVACVISILLKDSGNLRKCHICEQSKMFFAALWD